MIGNRRLALGAALALGGLGAFGTDYPLPRVRRESKLARRRGEWIKYRATKKAFNSRKRLAKRKAQRRARRITRMHAR